MPRVYFRKFRTRGVYANYKAFRRVIATGMRREVAPGIAGACNKVIEHWKKKPDWAVSHEVSHAGIVIDVTPKGPVGRIWTYHVKGVEGRTIHPRRHRQPPRARLYGRKGRKTGRGRRPTKAALRFVGRRTGDVVYARRVEWPGIKPRPYPRQAADIYRPKFHRVMENIVRRAVSAAQREGR